MEISLHDSGCYQRKQDPGEFFMTVEIEPCCWLKEKLTPTSEHHVAVEKLIHTDKTAFHEVIIADTKDFGRTMFVDGRIEMTSLDCGLYREMFILPSLMSHPSPKRALFISAGSPFPAPLLLAHSGLERLCLSIYDRAMFTISKTFFREHFSEMLEDERVRIFFEPFDSVLEKEEPFDLIYFLYPRASHEKTLEEIERKNLAAFLRSSLELEGVFVISAYSAYSIYHRAHILFREILSPVLPIIRPSFLDIPSFRERWVVLHCAKRTDPLLVEEDEIVRRMSDFIHIEFEHYSHGIHHSLFSLPDSFIRIHEQR